MKQWSFMLFCVYMMVSSVNLALDTHNNNPDETDEMALATSTKLWEIKDRCVNACSQFWSWFNQEDEDLTHAEEITDSLLVPLFVFLAAGSTSNQ